MREWAHKHSRVSHSLGLAQTLITFAEFPNEALFFSSPPGKVTRDSWGVSPTGIGAFWMREPKSGWRVSQKDAVMPELIQWSEADAPSYQKGMCFQNPFFWTSYRFTAAAAAKLLQSCPTLCDPIDGSPPGSPVPGILQARTLEWVAISFSNASKWKVKVKSLSRVQLLATPWSAAYQAPPSMGFSRQEYWSGVPLLSPAAAKMCHEVWSSPHPTPPVLTSHRTATRLRSTQAVTW